MNEKTATHEALLQHAGWLKGLALRLVRDASEADDLVQQTLLQAIRRPPRDAQAMGAWLARVARNEARQRGRSEQARTRRERRVARARTAQATIDIVERAELHRRLVDAVLAIEEPFRTAVLLRYFDGLEPKEIAERLGWPPATARTRLKRGLDRLRVAMDERSDGDRRAWSLSLLALVDPKDLVGAGAAATAASVGVSIMTTKFQLLLLAAFVLLVLGVIVTLSLRADDEVHEETDGARAELTASSSGAGGETRDPQLEGRPAATDEAASVPEVPTLPVSPKRRHARLQFTDGFGRALDPAEVERRYGEAGLALEVVVIDESVLGADSMIEAAIRRLTGSQEGRRVVRWSLGAEGLELELEPGSWRFYCARPGAAPLLTQILRVRSVGESVAIQIPLPSEVPTAGLRLIASDTGAPLPGARLVPYFEFGDDRAFFEGPALTADEGGEVRIPRMEVPLGAGRGRGSTWWVVAPGRLARVPPIALRGDEPQIVRVARTGTVHGKAYRQDGQPAAGLELVWSQKGRRVSTIVEQDGSFLMRGLPAGGRAQGLVLIEDAKALRLVMAKAKVMPGERTEVVIGEAASTSARGALLGRITAAGHPLEGALVAAHPVGKSRKERSLAKTDTDGRYRLTVPAGALEFMIYFGGADDFYVRSTEPLDLAQGQERTLDFDLPGGALLVTLLDAKTGEPILNGGAYAAPMDRDVARGRFPGFAYRAGSAATVGGDGTVLLRALVPGELHALEVRSEGYEGLEKTEVLPSRAGEDPVRLTVRLQRK